MAKATSKIARNKCKEFEMDLTDYVMGETTFLTKERQEKLFEHLRQCATCRDQLWNWKEVVSVMKTKQAMEKPEHQEKINKLIQRLQKELTAQPLPGEQPIDDEQELGTAADKIYRALKGNGKVAYPVLREKADLKGEPFYESIGWLAREKKIRRTRDEQTIYVALAETERQQVQTGV